MCNFYFAVYYENGSWQAAGRRFGRVFGKWGFKWSGKKTFTWGCGGGGGRRIGAIHFGNVCTASYSMQGIIRYGE